MLLWVIQAHFWQNLNDWNLCAISTGFNDWTYSEMLAIVCEHYIYIYNQLSLVLSCYDLLWHINMHITSLFFNGEHTSKLGIRKLVIDNAGLTAVKVDFRESTPFWQKAPRTLVLLSSLAISWCNINECMSDQTELYLFNSNEHRPPVCTFPFNCSAWFGSHQVTAYCLHWLIPREHQRDSVGSPKMQDVSNLPWWQKPGHQHPWYWLGVINRSLSSREK